MTPMRTLARYLRLYVALGRYGLVRELSFRGNFAIKLFVEILWLFLLLMFYATVFSQTSLVAGWNKWQYLFFVGCYFALGGLVEALFLSNCNEFADLVRTGDLDFYLLKPIDEQFLVTCREVDWSAAANVLMGGGIMGFALNQLGWAFDILRIVVFVLLFGCGVAITYSFLVFLTSISVWFKRNQSLYELWWLFTSLMRYPREIFEGPLASLIGVFFMFVIPVLVVVYVPATYMLNLLAEPALIAFTVFVTVALLFASRWFFRFALRRYRSASS
jgi:ABC-2 type transport system permease protein